MHTFKLFHTFMEDPVSDLINDVSKSTGKVITRVEWASRQHHYTLTIYSCEIFDMHISPALVVVLSMPEKLFGRSHAVS